MELDAAFEELGAVLEELDSALEQIGGGGPPPALCAGGGACPPVAGRRSGWYDISFGDSDDDCEEEVGPSLGSIPEFPPWACEVEPGLDIEDSFFLVGSFSSGFERALVGAICAFLGGGDLDKGVSDFGGEDYDFGVSDFGGEDFHLGVSDFGGKGYDAGVSDGGENLRHHDLVLLRAGFTGLKFNVSAAVFGRDGADDLLARRRAVLASAALKGLRSAVPGRPPGSWTRQASRPTSSDLGTQAFVSEDLAINCHAMNPIKHKKKKKTQVSVTVHSAGSDTPLVLEHRPMQQDSVTEHAASSDAPLVLETRSLQKDSVTEHSVSSDLLSESALMTCDELGISPHALLGMQYGSLDHCRLVVKAFILTMSAKQK